MNMANHEYRSFGKTNLDELYPVITATEEEGWELVQILPAVAETYVAVMRRPRSRPVSAVAS